MKYNNVSWQKYLLPRPSSGTTNTYKDFYGNITTQTTYPNLQTVSLLHMNWGWEDFRVAGEDDDQGNLLTNNGWYDCSVNYTRASSTQPDDFQYFQTIDYNIYPVK
jgi:hypothetical protein